MIRPLTTKLLHEMIYKVANRLPVLNSSPVPIIVPVLLLPGAPVLHPYRELFCVSLEQYHYRTPREVLKLALAVSHFTPTLL